MLCASAYSSDMSETTELIKRLRERGFSQTEISRRTGIPQPRLSRWEKGEVPDSADDALKLHALVAAEPGAAAADQES
jgi:transcriptional regulator with XRE-family HTH domain